MPRVREGNKQDKEREIRKRKRDRRENVRREKRRREMESQEKARERRRSMREKRERERRERQNQFRVFAQGRRLFAPVMNTSRSQWPRVLEEFQSIITGLDQTTVLPTPKSFAVREARVSVAECNTGPDNRDGENSSSCVICFEDIKSGDILSHLPCEHSFHKGCLEQWWKIKESCPLCRR